MPPVTPSTTRAPAYGRRWPVVTVFVELFGVAAAPAWHHAVLDRAARQLLEGAGRQLLLARRRTIAWELVQRAGMLRRDENAEVLVRRVGGHFTRCKDSHIRSRRMGFDFTLEAADQRSHLLPQSRDSFPAHYFGIDDR